MWVELSSQQSWHSQRECVPLTHNSTHSVTALTLQAWGTEGAQKSRRQGHKKKKKKHGSQTDSKMLQCKTWHDGQKHPRHDCGERKKRPKDGGGGIQQLQSSCDLVCGERWTREGWKEDEPWNLTKIERSTKKGTHMRIYEDPKLHGGNKIPLMQHIWLTAVAPLSQT